MVLQKQGYGMKLLLIIWQLPQFLLGYIVFMWHKAFFKKRLLGYRRVTCSDFKHVNSTVMLCKSKKRKHYRAFSLGRYAFLYYDSDYYDGHRLINVVNNVIKHEYGHSVQSARLGWLYLIVIGIVSLVMTSLGMSKKCYTEKWADKIVLGRELKITSI